MGSYTVGEALNQLLEKSHWKGKVLEYRMRTEWETIVGKTIARYTRDIRLDNRLLAISTDIGPLKQELLAGREQLIGRINEYFGEIVVVGIVIR